MTTSEQDLSIDLVAASLLIGSTKPFIHASIIPLKREAPLLPKHRYASAHDLYLFAGPYLRAV